MYGTMTDYTAETGEQGTPLCIGYLDISALRKAGAP
jgi:hypothetical protein